ncbi:MAG: hypothetical protein HOU81_01335 [Hamadaea sp.]|uniref:hypothetical protein n=1 Tax=Hamadaea sp. TaxID=2024425 RepID=UPI00181B9234|nr:hypothetical protein [Hamadaea sp.]NUR69441.1 hypothetical protein [Hamadaea sp.]NUT23396.1 hypothetical protein [Hamadaea sp.]
MDRLEVQSAWSIALPESSLLPEAHRESFAAAMAALMAEFTAYLDRPDADPAADMVGYRQHTVWLTAAELDGLIEDLRRAILPRLAQEPTAERARYLLSPILFPIEKAPVNEAEPG